MEKQKIQVKLIAHYRDGGSSKYRDVANRFYYTYNDYPRVYDDFPFAKQSINHTEFSKTNIPEHDSGVNVLNVELDIVQNFTK